MEGLNVAAKRKLTESEMNELRKELIHELERENDLDPEHMNLLLDYAFAIINNLKTISYVVDEVRCWVIVCVVFYYADF